MIKGVIGRLIFRSQEHLKVSSQNLLKLDSCYWTPKPSRIDYVIVARRVYSRTIQNFVIDTINDIFRNNTTLFKNMFRQKLLSSSVLNQYKVQS